LYPKRNDQREWQHLEEFGKTMLNLWKDIDMPTRTSKTGSELFIVDNSDSDRKVHKYLHDWCHLNKTYLRKIQALVGMKPVLRAWMELS
jgi:hypothetical protein